MENRLDNSCWNWGSWCSANFLWVLIWCTWWCYLRRLGRPGMRILCWLCCLGFLVGCRRCRRFGGCCCCYCGDIDCGSLDWWPLDGLGLLWRPRSGRRIAGCGCWTYKDLFTIFLLILNPSPHNFTFYFGHQSVIIIFVFAKFTVLHQLIITWIPGGVTCTSRICRVKLGEFWMPST